MSADIEDESLVGIGPEKDPLVFEVCWRLYRRGDHDILDGGVAPVQVARELSIGRKAAVRSLDRLREEGVVVKLHGANPTDYAGRTSYAPAALLGGEQR